MQLGAKSAAADLGALAPDAGARRYPPQSRSCNSARGGHVVCVQERPSAFRRRGGAGSGQPGGRHEERKASGQDQKPGASSALHRGRADGRRRTRLVRIARLGRFRSIPQGGKLWVSRKDRVANIEDDWCERSADHVVALEVMVGERADFRYAVWSRINDHERGTVVENSIIQTMAWRSEGASASSVTTLPQSMS